MPSDKQLAQTLEGGQEALRNEKKKSSLKKVLDGVEGIFKGSAMLASSGHNRFKAGVESKKFKKVYYKTASNIRSSFNSPASKSTAISTKRKLRPPYRANYAPKPSFIPVGETPEEQALWNEYREVLAKREQSLRAQRAPQRILYAKQRLQEARQLAGKTNNLLHAHRSNVPVNHILDANGPGKINWNLNVFAEQGKKVLSSDNNAFSEENVKRCKLKFF